MLGKMIVLYGINNLGKTLQAKKLVERIKSEGYRAEYIKYPIYNLVPTGPIINEYLRQDNPNNLSSREIQIIYTLNRLHFQNQLLEKLNSGIWIVAEDYVGTGLAWGGELNFHFLREINKVLISENISILLDGERFSNGIEKNHKHENNEYFISSTRDIFKKLAKSHDWFIVKANQGIESVHQDIYRHCCLHI